MSGSPRPTQAVGGSGEKSDKLDPYRPLANKVQRGIKPFLPPTTTTPTLSSLTDLDPTSYAHRLSGKTLILDPSQSDKAGSSTGPGTASSPLVTGKKRNRGDLSSLAKAREDVQSKESERADLGLVGSRKVRKRLGGVVKRGTYIDYQCLLPLHYLHTIYMIQLLSLSPLPAHLSSTPSTSASPATHSDPSSKLPPGQSGDGITSKLTKADFTGISLLIISSRNPSLVGIEGIVIEETASTFALVSKDDKARIIPKDGTLFRISIPAYAPPTNVKRQAAASSAQDSQARGSGVRRSQQTKKSTESGLNATEQDVEPVEMEQHLKICPRLEIDLLGSSFLFRSSDRAGRKFRPGQGMGGGSGWGENWVKGEWHDVFAQLEGGVDGAEGSSGKQKQRKKNKRKKLDLISNQGSTEDRPVPVSRNPPVIEAIKSAQDVEEERGIGADGKRKRSKHRRKDPPAGGTMEVFYCKHLS